MGEGGRGEWPREQTNTMHPHNFPQWHVKQLNKGINFFSKNGAAAVDHILVKQ